LQDRYHRPERLYFLPIGGTAMAPLAGLLQEMGHNVEGVDAQLYPPMSTLLEELGIPVRLGYDGDRLPREIDRVIIGNAVPRDNPEVVAVLDRGVPHLAQAEAVAHYVLARGQDSLVVAGTHGKTTTSSMLAWILERSGRDPSYLVGGLPSWSGRAHRLGGGGEIVIEGDEYNTAFFDRGPKFLHYRPHLFVLGPVEFDHADIYRDLDAVMTAFRAGAAQVPRHGAVVVNGWSDNARVAARNSTAPVVAVGPDDHDDLQVKSWVGGTEGSRAELRWRQHRLRFEIPMTGEHNLHNAAMALAAALTIGVEDEPACAALADFPGVARRLEVIGTAREITVVDDFAHHPTALAATIAAARQSWPGRRLVVAFEPRSLTAARRSFQPAYQDALAAADLVMVAVPFHHERLDHVQVRDRDTLAAHLAERGLQTIMPGVDDDPLLELLPELAAGDVVLVCSSGNFQNLHRRLLARIRGASGTIGR
jgi:UDP-N-acetylmuramate: L-alanyl-gamma-D-glutamyl-meso-diaminopimelate ligase